MEDLYIYISRWPEFVGKPGIALLRFSPETGELTFLEDLDTRLQCNVTCLDRDRNILYITNEVANNPDYPKGGGGYVYAYRIDPGTGRLSLLSRVLSCCPDPAYLSLDPSGKYLICANHSGKSAVTKAVQTSDGSWGMEILYDDATVNLYRLSEDGRIGPLIDVVRHTRTAPGWLLHSHPHSAVWDPSGSFFAVCDKGESTIHFYRIDYEKEKLVPQGEPWQEQKDSETRYCVFHPSEPYFFCNHEGNMLLSGYRYSEKAELVPSGSAECLPEGMKLPEIHGHAPGEKPGQQDLVISDDGMFIYDVVNGKDVDGISVFRVDPSGGAVERIQYLAVEGQWARGAAISPDGKFLVLACMGGDGAVMSFKIDEDGLLSPTGSKCSIPGAAYVTFYPGNQLNKE